jgi:hypothetical protein
MPVVAWPRSVAPSPEAERSNNGGNRTTGHGASTERRHADRHPIRPACIRGDRSGTMSNIGVLSRYLGARPPPFWWA